MIIPLAFRYFMINDDGLNVIQTMDKNDSILTRENFFEMLEK